MSYKKSIQVRKQILREFISRSHPELTADEYFAEVREISKQITLFERAEAERKSKTKRVSKVN